MRNINSIKDASTTSSTNNNANNKKPYIKSGFNTYNIAILNADIAINVGNTSGINEKISNKKNNISVN